MANRVVTLKFFENFVTVDCQYLNIGGKSENVVNFEGEMYFSHKIIYLFGYLGKLF
jgi:hypothetical protein